jgi:hypothetical protein
VSTQKKVSENSSFFKKFEKHGGEKMIIPGHPGGLDKIFFAEIVCKKYFLKKNSYLGVTGLLPYFLCKAYSPP